MRSKTVLKMSLPWSQSGGRHELNLSARILLHWFCRAPGSDDYPMTGVHYESGTELHTLDEVFPSLRNEIVDKNIVDFGCGYGYQAVALARAGARHVLGIEL